jgi:hypothetical protein
MEGHTIAAFHHNETWPKVGNECSSTTLRAWITMQIACVAVAIICILLEWVDDVLVWRPWGTDRWWRTRSFFL